MTVLSIILILVSGVIWGLREYQHKNLKVFELLFNANTKGPFGSDSWKLKYKNFDAGDKRPAYLFAFQFPLTDFWHLSKLVFASLLIMGTVLMENLVQLNCWIVMTICFALQSFAASITFYLIDKQIAIKS